MMTYNEALSNLIEAARAGLCAMESEAAQYHRAMAGYRAAEHQRLDDDIGLTKLHIANAENALAMRRAGLFDVTRAEIQLAVGKLSAQGWRDVSAVLRWLKMREPKAKPWKWAVRNPDMFALYASEDEARAQAAQWIGDGFDDAEVVPLWAGAAVDLKARAT